MKVGIFVNIVNLKMKSKDAILSLIEYITENKEKYNKEDLLKVLEVIEDFINHE